MRALSSSSRRSFLWDHRPSTKATTPTRTSGAAAIRIDHRTSVASANPLHLEAQIIGTTPINRTDPIYPVPLLCGSQASLHRSLELVGNAPSGGLLSISERLTAASVRTGRGPFGASPSPGLKRARHRLGTGPNAPRGLWFSSMTSLYSWTDKVLLTAHSRFQAAFVLSASV